MQFWELYSNLKSRNEFMPPFTIVLAGDYIPKDPCMYGIFTYIYHKNQPNVGNHTIHGSYGNDDFWNGMKYQVTLIWMNYSNITLPYGPWVLSLPPLRGRGELSTYHRHKWLSDREPKFGWLSMWRDGAKASKMRGAVDSVLFVFGGGRFSGIFQPV